MNFQLVSDNTPKGDQPAAIEALVKGLGEGTDHQVLLGITGSGKTFTIANVIQQTQRPTIVLAHNKTLAAQLYQEFKTFFPHNSVEYFVSYYDYYQPEAYVPASDTYIEKESTVNEEIDRLRMSATRALFERRDVIIVASVSCIYGLGDPDAYYGMMFFIEPGQKLRREDMLRKLVEMQYERSEIEFRARKLSRARRHGGDLSQLPGNRLPDRILGRRDRCYFYDRPAARRGFAHAYDEAADLSENTLCDVQGYDQARARRPSGKR